MAYIDEVYRERSDGWISGKLKNAGWSHDTILANVCMRREDLQRWR